MAQFFDPEDTESELRLIDAHNFLNTQLIRKTGQAAEQAYYALPDYRGAAQRQEYADLYEQIVFPARLEAAQQSVAFHREIARLRGKKFINSPLQKEDFFPMALRSDVGQMSEPYQMRPFRETYRYLAKFPTALDEAVKVGGARARILAQTDIQLARRQASLFARRANDNIVGYIRVLTGAESCGLCYVASTQRYRKGDLNPIHPGCDCGELPIYGDTDPGQVIDQYNLDRIRESFENKFGDRFGIGVDPSARDLDIGKFVEYKDGVRKADFTLVSVREHSELGPVLTRRKENFTTWEDIQERIRQRKRIAEGTFRSAELREAGLQSSRRQVLQRLRNAQTPAKINEIIFEELDTEVFYGGQIRRYAALDPDDIDVDSYRAYAEQLVELQDEYPAPLRKLELTDTDSFAYVYQESQVMGVTGKTIRKGDTTLVDHFSDPDSDKPKWLRDRGVDPRKYVAVHEYGHVLDNTAGRGVKPRVTARRLALKDATPQDLLEAVKENSPGSWQFVVSPEGEFFRSQDKALAEQLLVDKYIRENISGYALSHGKDRAEFVAEAFAQKYFLGAEASELATEITENVLAAYQRKVKAEAFKIADAVTQDEINELAADVLAGNNGAVPDDFGPIVQAVRIAGLVSGKPKTLLGAAIEAVTREVAINELAKRVRAQAETAQAVATEVAS